MDDTSSTQRITELERIDVRLQERIDAISSLLAERTYGVAMPESLDQLYEEQYYRRHAGRIRFALIAGIGLYLAFGIFDLAMGMLSDTIRSDLQQQGLLHAIAPFIAAVVLLPLLLAASRTELFARMHQSLISAGSVLAGIGGASLASAYEPPISFMQINALVLILWWVYSVSGLRVHIATAVGLVISAVGLAVLAQRMDAPVLIVAYVSMLFAAGNALGVLIGLDRRRVDRRSFLKDRRAELERELQENLSGRLRAMSREDALTGLANRRSFDENLELEWRRAMRKAEPLALISVDIDDFKAYNDHYGHQAGDECLRRVSHELSKVARRPGDVVARYGGEEFLILLSSADLTTARRVAENLCRSVSAIGMPHSASRVTDHVTVSAGFAACTPDGGELPAKLMSAADACLYRAKEAGRDRALGPVLSQS